MEAQDQCFIVIGRPAHLLIFGHHEAVVLGAEKVLRADELLNLLPVLPVLFVRLSKALVLLVRPVVCVPIASAPLYLQQGQKVAAFSVVVRLKLLD